MISERRFARLGALAAALVGVLSLVYAVAYLGITPSAQRGDDATELLLSVASNSRGLYLASACLVGSGIAAGVAVIALRQRIAPRDQGLALWATVAGVAGGLLSAAHGMSDAVELRRLGVRFAESTDYATRSAAILAQAAPSAVDPQGLFTFGVAGGVAIAFGVLVLPHRRALGWIGVALGVDLLVLFAATVVDLDALVLLSGALASVVLNPIWWFGIARLLARDDVIADASDPEGALVTNEA